MDAIMYTCNFQTDLISTKFSEKMVNLMVFKEYRSLCNILLLMTLAIRIPVANFRHLNSYMDMHFSIVSFFCADKQKTCNDGNH